MQKILSTPTSYVVLGFGQAEKVFLFGKAQLLELMSVDQTKDDPYDRYN